MYFRTFKSLETHVNCTLVADKTYRVLNTLSKLVAALPMYKTLHFFIKHMTEYRLYLF
jgi:hypothetical protein